MRMTNHFETRCIQRGISNTEVKMALNFGLVVRDRRTLGEKSCLYLIRAIERWAEEIEASGKTGRFDIDKKLR